MASGLRRVAKALGRPPEAVPADPRWLQPRLERIAPAALGPVGQVLEQRRERRPRGPGALRLRRRPHHRKTDLSPAWRVLWEAVLASGNRTLRPALGRFVYFLDELGVAPDAVTDEHAAAYRAALVADEIRKSPDKVFKNAIHAWNMAARQIDGWPQQRLSCRPTVKRVKLPLESFPRELPRRSRAVSSKSSPARSARSGGARRAAEPGDRRAVSPRAGALRLDPGPRRRSRRGDRRLGGARRARHGRARPAMDARPATGAEPRAASRRSRRCSSSSRKRYVRVSEADQKALARMAQRLAFKKQTGMTTKNRDRLRPLQDPGNLRRLLLLPDRLFARAEAGRRHPSCRASTAKMRWRSRSSWSPRSGARTSPMIHLDRNLHRPGDGRRLPGLRARGGEEPAADRVRTAACRRLR